MRHPLKYVRNAEEETWPPARAGNRSSNKDLATLNGAYTQNPSAQALPTRLGRHCHVETRSNLNDSTQAGGAPSTGEAVPRGGGGSVGRRVGSSDRLPPRTRMLIRWVSALPVKRAMVKQRFGSNPIGPEGLAYLDQKEAYYRISVLGVPRQLIPGSDDAEGVANLKQIIFLKRKNKKDIFPEMVDVQPQQRIVVVYAQFPRTDAVTLDDGRVELVMNFNAVKVKRKFKLKDMVFDGRLEL